MSNSTSNSQTGLASSKKGQEAETGFFGKIKHIYSILTIEPIILLFALGDGISLNISPVLYMDKICRVGSTTFGNGNNWDAALCDKMDNGTYDHIQEYVQKTYDDMSVTTALLKGIPAIIFTLFVGPWSDRFGRKLLLIMPLIGYVAYNAWFLVNVTAMVNSKPEWLMFEVFQFWFGGYMCFFVGAYCYVTDRTENRSQFRTVRIAIIDFTYYIGLAIAQGISGPIYEACGYVGIYAFGLAFQCLTIAYGIFAVKETKRTSLNEAEPEKAMSFGSVFSLDHVKESFGAMLKRRPDGSRPLLVTMVSLLGLYYLADGSIMTISIQYVRKRFTWSGGVVQFNNWYSSYMAYSSLAFIVIVPLYKQIFKFNDLLIVLICLVAYLSGLVTFLFAQVPNVLYLARFFHSFAGIVPSVFRSIASKVVGAQETGQIFACLGCTQVFARFMDPLYQLIYNATYEWYLGFCYALSSGLIVLMIGMTLICLKFWSGLIGQNHQEESAVQVNQPSRRDSHVINTDL